MANYVGINDWDADKAKTIIYNQTKKLTISQNPWVAPYVVLVFANDPEEQGEYAANVALKILSGAKISDFPIVSNYKWTFIYNQSLLEQVEIKLPPKMYNYGSPYIEKKD
ncbi:MAG: hypothetical protein HQK76_14540 [Desulfobacterales bacterium]|nr:hypothetical protein [Desulfobacterales bacterium]